MKILPFVSRVALAAAIVAGALCAPAVAQSVATVAPISDAATATAIPAPSFMSGAAKALWEMIVTPLAISGLASAISATLPQGQRGTWWGFARKVIDVAAWNWGNAANEPKA